MGNGVAYHNFCTLLRGPPFPHPRRAMSHGGHFLPVDVSIEILSIQQQAIAELNKWNSPVPNQRADKPNCCTQISRRIASQTTTVVPRWVSA